MQDSVETPGALRNQLLTERELAWRLKVSLRTVERLRVSGAGPRPIRIGKLVRYRDDWVDEWLKNRP